MSIFHITKQLQQTHVKNIWSQTGQLNKWERNHWKWKNYQQIAVFSIVGADNHTDSCTSKDVCGTHGNCMVWHKVNKMSLFFVAILEQILRKIATRPNSFCFKLKHSTNCNWVLSWRQKWLWDNPHTPLIILSIGQKLFFLHHTELFPLLLLALFKSVWIKCWSEYKMTLNVVVSLPLLWFFFAFFFFLKQDAG